MKLELIPGDNIRKVSVPFFIAGLHRHYSNEGYYAAWQDKIVFVDAEENIFFYDNCANILVAAIINGEKLLACGLAILQNSYCRMLGYSNAKLLRKAKEVNWCYFDHPNHDKQKDAVNNLYITKTE